jgi:two-component system sensor histidine kinase TctE
MHSPSLKRRLLLLVGLPLCAVLVCGAALTYGLALYYANRVYDRWLLDSARALGQLVNSDAGRRELSDQARILLQYDAFDRVVYAVRSTRYGLLSGDPGLPQPRAAQPSSEPIFTSFNQGDHTMRMVSVLIPNADAPRDMLVISAAETMRKRHLLARELLAATVPIEFALILLAMGLVWLGVNRGLRVLDPLARELRLRHAGDLSPLKAGDVPLEVQPLVATIDALLGRVDRMLAQQQRFIADAAHQLRTPLAGLKSQTALAINLTDDPALIDRLKLVDQSAARGAHLINQLLMLARADPDAVAVSDMAPLNVRAFVQDIVAEFVPRAMRNQIDLGMDDAAVPDGSPLQIRAHALLLREALTNVIDNAIKYTGRGGEITVRIQPDDTHVRIIIADNGPGIPEADRARVFERFVRATDQGEGCGLGLAIVRDIVAQHGGTVELRDAQPHGLQVVIGLPRI